MALKRPTRTGTAARRRSTTAPVRENAQARLARMGLVRPLDFVLHLPLRYEDETTLTPIAAVRPGQTAQIQARVVKAEVQYRGRRQLTVEVEDDSGALTLRFLHFYGSQLKHFEPGRMLRVRGELRGGLFAREMIHPRYSAADPDQSLPTSMTPVYPTTAGVSQAVLRTAIGRALATVDLDDTLLPAWRERLQLWPIDRAVRFLHAPPPEIALAELSEGHHPAWRRIKFDELLAQQLSLQKARLARSEKRALPLLDRATLVGRFRSSLPFVLTPAQERVWHEISEDLARVHPMQRLLQGDVGSGKTVVAALAALRAIENGTQAALMAPTEILADQHFAKISEWLEALGVAVVWLTGSVKKAQRGEAIAAIEAGRAQLVIGTHALIQDSVTFARLGLAIVDEQHRFGVGQRLALRAKSAQRAGQGEPHQLMMTATPIPRTLAMTYYADLDVSTIDALPPGRQPIATKLISSTRRNEVLDGVRSLASEGGQVYWVCPLIEESEALQLQTAVETHAALSAALEGLSVGLCHGRLPAAQKAAVMSAFARGEVQVLVATTVIEVGVDVPNANLMVIEHAERFGLSQLHQLRGRVGRGVRASTCILLYQTPLSALAKERLRVVKESADGFELAKRDLDMRGPGEFLGQRQSGVPLLRFADLEQDADLVEAAMAAAHDLLRDTSGLAQRHLDRWLGGRAEYLKA